jgi:hypothetical protein
MLKTRRAAEITWKNGNGARGIGGHGRDARINQGGERKKCATAGDRVENACQERCENKNKIIQHGGFFWLSAARIFRALEFLNDHEDARFGRV